MQTISIIITFIAAFGFGILAQRYPKRGWDYIQSWPAFVLLMISTLVYQVEFYQARAPAIVEGVVVLPEPSLQPLIDWLLGGFASILLDIPFVIFGVWIGRITARIIWGKVSAS